MLYVAAHEESIRKAANLRKTLESAAEMSPRISAFLDGKDTPQLPAPQQKAENEKKTRQFFFDRWKAHAETTNDQEVRAFLAGVLAGEVDNAGSFSVKTLDVLMNLEREDALAFKELSKYIVTSDDEVEAAVPMMDDAWFVILLRLSEAELLSSTPSQWTFSKASAAHPRYFLHAGLVIRPTNRSFFFEARAVTRAGRQIAALFVDQGVQHELMQFLLKQGPFETSTYPNGTFFPWGEESAQDT